MKLRVKPSVKSIKSYRAFSNPDMDKFIGKIIVVEEHNNGVFYYKQHIGPHQAWYWYKEWLEQPTKFSNEEVINGTQTKGK